MVIMSVIKYNSRNKTWYNSSLKVPKYGWRIFLIYIFFFHRKTTFENKNLLSDMKVCSEMKPKRKEKN